MNPFLWSGPAFMVFYLVLCVGVLAACWVRARAKVQAPRVKFSPADLSADPYRIAYLRGGYVETVRVATFNLVDRGWLQLEGKRVQAARAGEPEGLRRPLDRAILATCRKPRKPSSLPGHGPVRQAATAYEGELAARGLLLPPAEARARTWIGRAAIAVLLGVAMGKCGWALFHDFHNVSFLTVAAIVAAITAGAICHPRVPKAGKDALASMRALVGRLESNASRLKQGGATNEALLLVAVLGLYALPGDTYAFVEEMYPRPKPTGSDGSGDSSPGGSSCSSSCGGGGGCGGCGGG